MNKVNNPEENIIPLALQNLEEATQIKGAWRSSGLPNRKGAGQRMIDGEIELKINGATVSLFVEVKKELRNHHLYQVLDYAGAHQPFMVIAEKISPGLKEELRQNGIAYLEVNGNIWLSREGVLIWIDGNKPVHTNKAKTNRAFTKTGLKVVFHFLLDEALLDLPYRGIAAKTGVALGQVNYVFNGLKEMGFLVKLNKDQYRLANKKALLEKWMEAYAERLKPSLAIGTFRFLKREDFESWKKIPLQTTKSRWGGEAAGDLYTNYLKPAELTLYTAEKKAEFMKNYCLVPDLEGNVNVYEKFWNDDEANTNVVPPLLAYTDLVNTGDKRCMDTANLIYDAFKDRFE